MSVQKGNLFGGEGLGVGELLRTLDKELGSRSPAEDSATLKLSSLATGRSFTSIQNGTGVGQLMANR